jgi:hypothetical protein
MVAATIRDALADWSWLRNMDALEIVGTTCLGDVILRDSLDDELILDVGAGELRPYDAYEQNLVKNLGNLIARMEESGLKLEAGKCYGLKPHAIFQKYDPDNMYVATMAEYVSYMGWFHGEVKDLPDGAKVRLVVKE